MIGLLALYAALTAHTAVAMGALDKPIYTCIEPALAEQREKLVDRAFARAVAMHDTPEGTRAGEWQIRQAFAYIGSKLAFSSNYRTALVMPALESLPVCDRSRARGNQAAFGALLSRDG